jgi:hypothetical protein
VRSTLTSSVAPHTGTVDRLPRRTLRSGRLGGSLRRTVPRTVTSWSLRAHSSSTVTGRSPDALRTTSPRDARTRRASRRRPEAMLRVVVAVRPMRDTRVSGSVRVSGAPDRHNRFCVSPVQRRLVRRDTWLSHGANRASCAMRGAGAKLGWRRPPECGALRRQLCARRVS